MTKTFRTVSGKRVRVQMTEEEAMQTIIYRIVVVLVPCFWMAAFFRAAGLI